MLERKVICDKCGEDYPPSWPHTCDSTDIEVDETDCCGYCQCGALHSDEEIDWNECDSCGGKVN